MSNNKNSLLWQLKKHIDDGHAIGLQGAVLEALEYATMLLQTKRGVEVDQQAVIDSVMGLIDQVINNELTPVVSELVDEIDSTRKESSNYPSAKIYCHNKNNKAGCSIEQPALFISTSIT